MSLRLGKWICLAIVLIGAAGSSALAASPSLKVLRIAFNTAENGFDPARLGDNTSLVLTTHLFEGLVRAAGVAGLGLSC